MQTTYNDFKINLESLLLSYYIKYDVLLKLNQQIDAPPDTQFVDVYIDLFDMLKRVYGTNVYANKKFLIVSSIINLAAHIRGYYLSRHRIWARIYLVYADESTNNHRQFVPSFNTNDKTETLNYQETNNFIQSQLELAKILCAYINDVYLVRKHTDFSMFTYTNILKHPDSISIILTRSKYVYQIPALIKNAYIFRPRKYNGEDTSIIITNKNVIFSYYNKINKESILQEFSIINPGMLSLLMCFTGVSDKNVKSIANITKATKIISYAIRSNRIINGYNSDTSYLYAVLEGLSNIIDLTSFEYRFKAIDIIYQSLIYNQQIESLDESWNINLKDIKTFQEISNKYFIDNPLDVNNL